MRQPHAILEGTASQTRLDNGRTRLRDILHISRPRFWIASVVPVHVGFVLATHRLVPRLEEFWTLLLVLIAVGPLLWLSALAFNDANDVDTDRLNPRKTGSPLASGRMTPREATTIGTAAGAGAVLVATFTGPLLMIGTALTVALAWAYSAPPLRLKARPGFDVATNAFAVGVLGPLGGWVALTDTVAGYPWQISLIGTLAAAALYLPTTAADRDADKATRIRTTAVALGPRATFELGFALWSASAAIAFVLAFTGTVLDTSLLPVHTVMAPLLLALYRVLLRDRPRFGAITVVAAAYVIPCAAFVVTYVT